MQPNKFFEKAHNTMVCAHEETEDLLGCTVSSTRRGAGAGLSENNFLVWGKKKKTVLY